MMIAIQKNLAESLRDWYSITTMFCCRCSVFVLSPRIISLSLSSVVRSCRATRWARTTWRRCLGRTSCTRRGAASSRWNLWSARRSGRTSSRSSRRSSTITNRYTRYCTPSSLLLPLFFFFFFFFSVADALTGGREST